MALKLINTENKYNTELNFVAERNTKAHQPAVFAKKQLIRNRLNRLCFKLEQDETLFSDICFWGGTHPEITTVAEQRQYLVDRLVNEFKCRIEDLALNLSRRGFLYEEGDKQFELDCGMDYPEDPYRIPVEDFDVEEPWGAAGIMDKIGLYATIPFRMRNTQTGEIKLFHFSMHVGKEIGSCIQPQNIDERMKQLMGELKNG